MVQVISYKDKIEEMLQAENREYYILRFASAMCFIGHGAFGIITKQVWCNYFAVFGIGGIMAHRLMPLLGTVDILLGISILVYPTRAVLSWLVVWGLVTAALRPLSGEPFMEMLERAGNYGVPLALLLLCNNRKKHTGIFSFIKPPNIIDRHTLETLRKSLRIVVFLLFIGHGWLNIIEKKGLLLQYASLGISNPAAVAHYIGIFEIAAAFAVLVKPVAGLVLILFIWKMGTELFYPHWELFEWIERGGSYGAILCLWFTLTQHTSLRDSYALAL